jgi:hypothetical protein
MAMGIALQLLFTGLGIGSISLFENPRCRDALN